MKNMVVALVLVLLLGSVSFATMENLVSDGGFDSGILNSAGKNTLSITTDNLDKWYTFSQGKKDFYRITEEGYVTADSKQQWSRLLVQVIAAPEAGLYDFGFDYRLTDDSDMYSVVRVFAVDDDNADFSVSMTACTGSFSNVTSAARVYDQGGSASYLPTAIEWTSVSGTVNVDASVDYLVIYAAFSHDGSDYSLRNEVADLDNFSLTAVAAMQSQSVSVPEPATLAMLGLGACSLVKMKRN
jgi:hypothetical protein